jgi:hypothetical protein
MSDARERRAALLKRSRGLLNVTAAILIVAAIILLIQVFTSDSILEDFPTLLLIAVGYGITFYSGRIRRRADQINPQPTQGG